MAKTSLKVKQRENLVFNKSVHKMQNLRKTALSIKEVRNLPYMLQRTCIQG